MAALLPVSRPIVLGVLCAVAGAGLASAEELTLVSKVTGLRGGQTVTEYVSGDRVRIKEGDFESLFETGSGRMVFIDHQGKDYFETTAAEVGAYIQAVRTRSGHAADPPAGTVSVRKQADSKLIAGRSCEHYVLSVGGLSLEVWVDPRLEGAAHAEAERLAAARSGGTGPGLQSLYAELKSIKGLPLAELRTGGSGSVVTRSRREAVEVRVGTLPPGSFEVPVDYKKKDSPYRAVPQRPLPPKAR